MNNAGFGSYVALMVMVLFGINDAPAYVVLTLGISVGLMSALVLCVLAAGVEVAYILYETMNKLKKGDSTEFVELYLGYIYEQSKMSNLSKGTD